MTTEQLKEEVLNRLKYKPAEWRDGQFVFNYIDNEYCVARTAQFKYGVDCFYNDDKTDEFIELCAQLITEIRNE